MLRILVALLAITLACAENKGEYFFVQVTPTDFDKKAVLAIDDLVDDLKPEIKNHPKCDCYIFLAVNQSETDLLVAVGRTPNPVDQTINVTSVTPPYRLSPEDLRKLARMIEEKAQTTCRQDSQDQKQKAD